MCGIAGVLDPSRYPVERLDAVLRHRGPDDRGGFEDANFLLFHVRLAIQDVALGRQPMTRGHLTAVLNGEIYNHSELRARLLPGVSFATRSDTETLLALYEKKGTEAFGECDGMFAFAVYDRRDRTVILVRDRAGKKPLYYRLGDGEFLFASEINALKALVPLTIAEERIPAFLRLGSFYRSLTPYREARELEPGTWMKVDLKTLDAERNRWWDFGSFFRRRGPDTLVEALEAADHFLNIAVKRRIEASDLEVGTFLSGGIDSGLVTAVASRYRPGIRAFTAKLPGAYDESAAAAATARHLDVRHETVTVELESLADEIPRILARYGEPFADSSAIPTYFVAKAAKRRLTVVLNGDGADELFGGYRRHVPFAYRDFFSRPAAGKKFLDFLTRLLPSPRDKMGLYNYLHRLAHLSARAGSGLYLSATTDIFEGYENRLADSGKLPEAFTEDLERLAGDTELSGLKKLMIMDFGAIFGSDLLVKMDIATMAHALEARSPFLGREMLEFAPTLPDRLKIRRTTTKFLLRELARRYLPAEIVTRPKRGFEIPLKIWVDGELKVLIRDHLTRGAWCRNFVDGKFLDGLLDGVTPVQPEKRAKMLWTLTALEIWKRNA